MSHFESAVTSRVCRFSAFILLTVVLAAAPASAQTPAPLPLADVLPTLLGSGMRIAPGPGGTHANDFVYGSEVQPFSIRGHESSLLTQFVAEQLTTFPLSSSSGGFLYTFDPNVGTFVRSTNSFGPIYVERALTSGRGTLSVGFNAQRLVYDRISGVPLDSPEFRIYYLHRDRLSGSNSLTPERSDVIEATLNLKVRNNTWQTSMTYGVTDRLDLGLLIPLVETTLEAQVDRRILRLGTAADPTIHSFDGRGGSTSSSSAGGTASGVGDLHVVGKYNVLRRRSYALAAAWDIRLPTGDADNLLGTGHLDSRVLAVVSGGGRVFSPHASVGATFVVDQEALGAHADTSELHYAGGIDWAVVSRATISADLLMRSSFGDFGFQNDLRLKDSTIQYVTTPNGRTQDFSIRELGYGEGPAIMHAAIGGKVALWRTALAVANVIFPLSDARLQNKPALSLGLEYTF